MQQLDMTKPIGASTRGLLAGLGSTAGEVARYFDELGVRGVRNNSECCAVAEFLSAVVRCDPEVRSVRVFRRVVLVTRTSFGWFSLVRLPRPVRTFVLAFDAGAYPSLVRGTNRPLHTMPSAHGRAPSAG